MADVIVLHNSAGRREIPVSHVFFPFADGRFAYDCVTCRAACCRATSYHAYGSEAVYQLALRPSLGWFADQLSQSTDAAAYSVRSCPPACFFLDDRGRCEVELEQGHAAKPETCRLFPFNNMRRLGSYLIVAPHAGLCPLQVVEAGRTAVESGHSQLLNAMVARDIRTTVPDAIPVSRETTPDRLIALERALVVSSEAFLTSPSYDRFAAAQIEATHEALGMEQRAPAGAAVEEWRQAADAIMGEAAPSRTLDAAAIANLVATTSAVRTRLLFSTGGTDQKVPYLCLLDLPYILLSLEAFVRHAAASGMRDVTFQTLNKLLDAHWPVIHLLAVAHRRMSWRRDACVESGRATDAESSRRYLGVVRELMKPSPLPLWRIISDAAPGPRQERIRFIQQTCRGLSGRIVRVEDRIRTTRAVVPTVQRWMLQHVGSVAFHR